MNARRLRRCIWPWMHPRAESTHYLSVRLRWDHIVRAHLHCAHAQVCSTRKGGDPGTKCSRLRHVCLVLLALLVTGCGYVQVKVTAPPVPPTPTGTVYVSTPVRRATSTPVPATPLPTATPTATPTPIVHVVQRGDLLIHIATQYDASMQAIIEANVILNPNSLPIGQELIIPRSQEEVERLRPTATPTPMPLQTIHVGLYRTPMGSVWCLGEVENERDEALDLVQVRVSLYGSNGELLDQGDAFTLAEIVPGHGVAPFAVLLPGAPAGGFASHEVEILSAEPVTVWGKRHRALEIEGLAGDMHQGSYLAAGTVRNRSQDDATGIRVTITAYSTAGAVVGVRQLLVDRLAAGEDQPFEVEMVPAEPAVEVSAVVWGMKE